MGHPAKDPQLGPEIVKVIRDDKAEYDVKIDTERALRLRGDHLVMRTPIAAKSAEKVKP